MTGKWLTCRIVPAVLLALSLAVLPGCSMLSLGYGQLDTFAAWTANDYFDMEPDQRQEFSRRFDRLHDWHRYEQLPDYVTFLTATRTRLQDGIKREDVLWVIEGLKQRYRAVVRRGADDAAAMLLTVTPAQIEILKRQWDQDNHRFARDYRINESVQEQREARLKRALKRITDWTGSLGSEQEAKITAIVKEWPPIHRLRYEDRLRRQREFLQLLSQRGDARQFTDRFRHWLSHWEEGRDPEYARLFGDWEQKQADLYITVSRMLTPQQSAAVLRRVQSYIDDFTRLAQRPDAPSPAGR
jgi:hypothetical protein